MEIKIKRYEEEGIYEDMIMVTVNGSLTRYYHTDKFYESHAMYSHILGCILSELFDKWSYKVSSEYVDEEHCSDMEYTCRVYYDSELVIESSYNEYNGCGYGIGIVQTIESFAEFDIDVEIEQEWCCGGWCYDEDGDLYV